MHIYSGYFVMSPVCHAHSRQKRIAAIKCKSAGQSKKDAHRGRGEGCLGCAGSGGVHPQFEWFHVK